MSDSNGFRQPNPPDNHRHHHKSHFVQTCNLLSQYIKEKGSLRNLNLEIGGRVENLEALVKSAASASATIQPSKSVINTPQDSAHNSTSKDSSSAATSSDSKAPQLTIFYSGKVLVFDDYPADKAKELVAFAKRGAPRVSYGILSNTLPAETSPASASPREAGLPPRPQAVSPAGISSNTCKAKIDKVNGGGVASTSTGSDLPIARRSSIHRFLEKRKDRAAARGPYQVQEQPISSLKGDDNLDLKL